MTRLCLCLTGKTLGRNLEILEKYRNYADMAELRVDCLDPDERFLIRRFPEQAGLPVILTIRRDTDGGKFTGGEGARIILLSKGLAFAEADHRRNFAYVDLEEDLNVPSLEEAARTCGTRIIRSCHNSREIEADIEGKLRSLLHVGDEIAKVAVTPQNIAGLRRIYQAAKAAANFDKILIGMGRIGSSTRILAEPLGSYLSYAALEHESGITSAAPGQFDIKEMVELYRFKKINSKTRIFAVTGYPLQATASPLFFNRVFAEEDIDAVYLPFPADSLEDFLDFAMEIGIDGVSVTVPYKEKLLPYLLTQSADVRSVGACNTIVRSANGWLGYNTDARGFSDSLLGFIGGPVHNLRGKRITIIGAGGAARAVASEVFRLKGKALILNRTSVKARDLAGRYRFAWGCIDNQGMELMYRFSDMIIQTTPVGMEGGPDGDPAADYAFSGKEVVMDLIYKPERSIFLQRAAAAGCAVLNGYDMLLRQARYQYRYFMGNSPSS
jgi:3-dehydroquinate dehydratase/shikimate dehydrogenase